MYIALEGIDGVGKSTQVKALRLKDENILSTYEPGNTELGKSLREILLYNKICTKAELFLFLADRAEHFNKVIKPNKDKIILSDRSLVSGIAYAITNDENAKLSFLIELNKFALEEFLPQKIVFLKADESLISSRQKGKKLDKIENRGFEYLLKVQDNMQKVISLLGIDFIDINASLPVEEITKKIQGFIYG